MLGRTWPLPRLAAPEIQAGGRSASVPALLVGALLFGGGEYLFLQSTDISLALGLIVAAGFFLAHHAPVVERVPDKILAVVPRLRWWLLLLPIVSLAPALGILGVVNRSMPLVWAYGAVLLATLGAAWFVDRPRGASAAAAAEPSEPPTRSVPWERWAVVALLAVSFFIRVWQYDSVPWSILPDDAELAIRGRDIWDGRSVTPFMTGFFRHPELHSIYVALFFVFELEPLLQFQLAGAVPGTIAVGVLYALARQAYSVPVALTIALLFTFNRWWVLVSRLGNDFALQILLALLAAWLTWKALQSGRVIWFVLLGIVSGIALIYLYLGSIGPILAFAMWAMFRNRAALSPRAGFLGLVVAGVTAAAVAIPRFYVIASEPMTLGHWLRYGQAGGAGDPGAVNQPYHFIYTVVGLVHRSVGRTTHMFADEPGPLLDPVSALLTMLGAGVLLYFVWRRQPWGAFWGLFFVLGMLVASSTTGKDAYSYRNIMILPAAAVGGGLALVSLAHTATSWLPRLRVLLWPLVGVAILAVAFSTYQDYFVGFKERERVWRETLPNELAAGRWLWNHSDSLEQRQVFTTVEIANWGTFQLSAPRGYTRKGYPFTVIKDELSLPLPLELPPSVERVTLLSSVPPWVERHASWAEAAALRYYPNPTAEPLYASNGRQVLTVYDWGREDFESRQGLMRDPAAECVGGSSAEVGGWSGLLFIPEHGEYRLQVANAAACANVGLRSGNALGRQLYLGRGWHEISVVTPGGVRPELILERQGGAQPPGSTLIPRHYLYSGSIQPFGLEARFAEAPGEPFFERRYLSSFDQVWHENPPTRGQSFYVEATGLLQVPRDGDYHIQLVVSGPATLLLDREVILSSQAKEQRGLSERRTLAAGEHQLEIRYHAPTLAPTQARFFADREPPARLDVLTLRQP